jgi:hypothetical protein
MAHSQSVQATIRALNDQMRSGGLEGSPANRWLITPGVIALGLAGVKQAIERVRSFDTFEADNDPYQEHDFGAFDLAGERLFWKIDYYDRTLAAGSPDPSDTSVTCRVLTVMLASEY